MEPEIPCCGVWSGGCLSNFIYVTKGTAKQDLSLFNEALSYSSSPQSDFVAVVPFPLLQTFLLLLAVSSASGAGYGGPCCCLYRKHLP